MSLNFVLAAPFLLLEAFTNLNISYIYQSRDIMETPSPDIFQGQNLL